MEYSQLEPVRLSHTDRLWRGYAILGKLDQSSGIHRSDGGLLGKPCHVVGETTELQWMTVYSNYSVALWQQHPGGGWATLGPVIYRTSCATVIDSQEDTIDCNLKK